MAQQQPNMAVKEDSVIVVGKPITPRDYASKKDRARAAYEQKNSEYKSIINFATNLHNQEVVVTNCGVYNATGDSMKLVAFKDWNGQVQTFYPQEIGNGQWGLFVHTKRPLVPEGSKAAVVYRVKDDNGNECDWLTGWNNPRKKDIIPVIPDIIHKNTIHAYTEIREVGHFSDDMWSVISKDIDEAGLESTDTQHGCTAVVSITAGSPAYLDAVITIQN